MGVSVWCRGGFGSDEGDRVLAPQQQLRQWTMTRLQGAKPCSHLRVQQGSSEGILSILGGATCLRQNAERQVG